MIDSGVDLAHAEFAGRPNTIALNTQTFDANQDEFHGTVDRLGRQRAGQRPGIVGIYPQAKLQLWDASPTGQLTVGDEIARPRRGAAPRAGRDQPQPRRLRPAADRGARDRERLRRRPARRRLVRKRPRGGQLALLPASFAHVLTIGATDEADRVTVFSSASAAMDLAAPGQDIEAAIPTLWDPAGWRRRRRHELLGSARLRRRCVPSGRCGRPCRTRSCSEVMRRSARDVGKAGWDRTPATASSTSPPPWRASRRPSTRRSRTRTSTWSKPNGLTRDGKAPLTAQHRRARDDQRPARAARGPGRRLPHLPAGERQGRRHRAAERERQPRALGQEDDDRLRAGLAPRSATCSASRPMRAARFERITLKGRGSAQFVYADVFLPKTGVRASYSLSVAPAAR